LHALYSPLLGSFLLLLRLLFPELTQVLDVVLNASTSVATQFRAGLNTSDEVIEESGHFLYFVFPISLLLFENF
jgi:hypothetical protein